MRFPQDMTQEDIMNFELELNRIIDQERGEGQYWTENAELQIVCMELRGE